jgi:hypothetical protein
MNMNYAPLFWKATVIFLISQFICFLTYAYFQAYSTVPQAYIDNLVAKCPSWILDKMFDERAFPYIGKTALGFGAYLGILF